MIAGSMLAGFKKTLDRMEHSCYKCKYISFSSGVPLCNVDDSNIRHLNEMLHKCEQYAPRGSATWGEGDERIVI